MRKAARLASRSGRFAQILGVSLILLSWSSLLACASQDLEEQGGGAAAQDLTGPSIPGLPAATYRLTIRRGSITHLCFANHVAPGWLLVASHCFVAIGAPNDGVAGLPPYVDISAWNNSDAGLFTAVNPPVYFHPGAIKTKTLLEWTKGIEVQDLDCAHDLALVRMNALEGQPIVPLYAPACPAGSSTSPCAAGLAGLDVTFGGNKFPDGYATGTNLIQGYVSSSFFKNGCPNTNFSSKMLLLDPTGGAVLDPGDSGTGLLAAAPGPSVKYDTISCNPVTLPQPGQTALIGIASIATTNEQGVTTNAGFVPTFLPEHAEWITSKFAMDADGDGACDAMDNCPEHKNADQRNSNSVAERAWGSYYKFGIEYGDACDPAPTPVPRLSGLAKATEGFARQRIVRDRIRVEPVLGVGAVSSDEVRSMFCMCRTADGKPIANPKICESPPFHCKANAGLILNDEGNSGSALLDTETTWHRTEVSQFPKCTLLNGCVGTKFPVSYPSGEYQLGYWNYTADNTRWLVSGFFAPIPPTPGYPAGTDLAGVLWLHGNTQVGAATHGVSTGTPCLEMFKPCAPQNIADGYQFGVAPDRRNEVDLLWLTALQEIELPVPYCSPCGDDPLLAGENDLDPIPVVSIDPASGHSVYWLEGGNPFSADEALSPELRAAFIDPSLRWVPPSEPINLLRSSTVPRAVALDATGTGIETELLRSASGFQLRRSRGDRIEVAALSSSGPPARSGFGAAFSRAADALFVAGGRLPGGSPAADVWRHHASGWSSVPLATARQPVDVRAACFTARDARLWLLDVEHGPGGKRRWFLYRIAPVTGAVELLRELPFLQPFDAAWLGATEDGTMMLAATKEQAHFIAELRPATADKLTVARCALGAGRLVKRPDVLYGRITRAVRRKLAGEPRVFVEHVALGQGPCGLENDL